MEDDVPLLVWLDYAINPVALGSTRKSLFALCSMVSIMSGTNRPFRSPFRRFRLWMMFAAMTLVAVQCALGMAGDALILMCFAAFGFAMGWIYDGVIGDKLFDKCRENSFHLFARPTIIVASFCFLFPMVFRLCYVVSGLPFVRPNIPGGRLMLAMIFPSEISTWLFFSSDAREPTPADLVGGYLIGCTFIAVLGSLIGLIWGAVRRFVLPVRPPA